MRFLNLFWTVLFEQQKLTDSYHLDRNIGDDCGNSMPVLLVILSNEVTETNNAMHEKLN